MNRLERHIAAAVLRATLLSLAVLVTLFIVVALSDELDAVGEGGYTLAVALQTALLSAPRYVYEAFPIAVLVGGLLGLGTLASHAEITAMRAAGFGVPALTLAVLKVGALMLVVAFVLGELIAPQAETRAQQLRASAQGVAITLHSEQGLWVRDAGHVVNVRGIHAEGRLADVRIFALDAAGELLSLTHAAEAVPRAQGWMLHQVARTRIGPQGVSTEHWPSLPWAFALDRELLDVLSVRPSMLPLWGLYRYIRFLQTNRLASADYQVAFWSKLATPLAAMVMLLLAVPLSLGDSRSRGMGQRVLLGAIIGAVFFLLSRLLAYSALVYGWPPALATLLPVLTALALGLTLLSPGGFPQRWRQR